MKILVIGSGGREHALAAAYSKSNRVTRVYVAPGNGLMDYRSNKIQAVPEVPATDLTALLLLARQKKIDFVDVATDDALALGFVDTFTKEKIPAFGPLRAAAEIEWNKDWSRNFMQQYMLPIPSYQSFSDISKATEYVKKLPEQVLYIKASGLALGKGVIRADGKHEARVAIESMQSFGSAGKTFLIEEAMSGEEFSLFAMCDGEHFVITQAAQDHKTVFNGDVGMNTGGMGCISPTTALSEQLIGEIKKNILKPFLKGMQQEGRPYRGVLYLGGMITKTGVKIVEFNARWGDPEAEVIVPGITTDYLSLVEAVIHKKLHTMKVTFDRKTRVSVAGCSGGYPVDYSSVKGKEIFGIPDVLQLKNVTLFGAGIMRKNNRFLVNGGRIFHISAEGNNILEARKRAYSAMSLLHVEGNNLHYRTDIGWREIERFSGRT
jgi:phosphoribosylamine---glycine ligase